MAAEAVPTGAVPVGLRSGPGYWLAAYRSMLGWQLASLRMFLPLLAAVQVLAGVGFVLGFGLLFPGQPPASTALYIATGVPVINLYILGLIVLPQVVGQQKTAQTYDFVQSLPVPRAVGFAAWYTVTVLVGLPGMLATMVVAELRYHVGYSVSPLVIPAVLLVTLTATAIGYALGHGVQAPMATQVITQALNFFAMGFAPVCFPREQLPSWLATVNRVLPFESMAVVMRSALHASPVAGVPRGYAVLAGWAVGCLLVAVWAVGRRG